MTATRTQVNFTEEQRRRIDRAAETRDITMAELVREAVDEYLGDEVDPAEARAATFGAAPEATARSRDDWQRG